MHCSHNKTFKVDECNFVKTAVIIGTKQLFTSVFLLYGMNINLSTDGQKRTTTSQHKENNNWRPTKNNYLTTQRKQSLATNKEQLPHSTKKTITGDQQRTTTSQHKENNHWRPTKNNYLTAQTKQHDVCVMSSLNN